MDASEISKLYISISDQVISKIRSELVSNGKLNLSLLNEIHATWQRKMIQAGVISGTSVTVHAPLQTHEPNPLPEYTESEINIDPKELEMFIMVHDGYGESGIDFDALFPSNEVEMFTKNEHEGFYIPQKDGSGDGDDADIKPNIHAPITNEDDEELNENDDDVEEEGGMDYDNIQNLIVCQFDNVKRKSKSKSKSKHWECKLKAGVMHLNGKELLFSEAKGDFDF